MSTQNPPIRRAGRGWLVAIFGAAAVAFSLLSLVNHYLFRTFSYDLGLFNHAMWDYAHLRWNANSVKQFDNILGDHFTVLQLAFAPLWWVFRSWTLLVVQIGAVLFGGWGAWRLHSARLRDTDPHASAASARWLTLHFFCIWGLWTALGFDYHDNVVGAMFLPWLLLAFYERRGRLALLVTLAILLSKENMALWLVCVGLGLAWLYRTDQRRYWALGLSVAGGVYFKVVTGLVMPAISPTGTYIYTQHYAALGQNFGEVAQTLLSRPLFAISLLWRNFPQQVGGDGVKAELHLLVLLSGGLALLRRPAYAVMLASIYAQKLLSSLPALWGTGYQYSIEFVPILNAAVGHWVLSRPSSEPIITRLAALVPARLRALPRPVVAAFTALLALGGTQLLLSSPHSPGVDKTQLRFFSKRHYRTDYDAAAIRRGLAVIPPDVPVSAHSDLQAHLADRSISYLFPFVGEAEYLVLLPNANPYPLDRASYARVVQRLRRSPDWVEVPQPGAPALLILRRSVPVLAPPYLRRRYEGHPVELADSLTLADLTEPQLRKTHTKSRTLGEGTQPAATVH